MTSLQNQPQNSMREVEEVRCGTSKESKKALAQGEVWLNMN